MCLITSWVKGAWSLSKELRGEKIKFLSASSMLDNTFKHVQTWLCFDVFGDSNHPRCLRHLQKQMNPFMGPGYSNH